MSRKTRKLIWSAPLVAVLAVAGALAIFVALSPHEAAAHEAAMHGAPGPVTGLTAAQATDDPATGEPEGRTQITLTWMMPAAGMGDPAASYRIDYSDQPTRTRVWRNLEMGVADASADMYCGADAAAGLRCFTDTSLKPGQIRSYRVFAVNNLGTSPVSTGPTYATATTLPYANPSPVQGLTATTHHRDQIVLNWQPPTDTGGAEIEWYCVALAATEGTIPNPTADAEAENCLEATAATPGDVAYTSAPTTIVVASDTTSYTQAMLTTPDVISLYYRVYTVTDSDGDQAVDVDPTGRRIAMAASNIANGRTVAPLDIIDTSVTATPYAVTNLRWVASGTGDPLASPVLRLYWTLPGNYPPAPATDDDDLRDNWSIEVSRFDSAATDPLLRWVVEAGITLPASSPAQWQSQPGAVDELLTARQQYRVRYINDAGTPGDVDGADNDDAAGGEERFRVPQLTAEVFDADTLPQISESTSNDESGLRFRHNEIHPDVWLDLIWNEEQNDNGHVPTGYEIDVTEATTIDEHTVWTPVRNQPIDLGATRQYTHKGVIPGKQYTYRVFGEFGGYLGIPAVEVASSRGAELPAPVRGLTVDPDPDNPQTSLVLNWPAVTNNGGHDIMGYLVQVGDDEDNDKDNENTAAGWTSLTIPDDPVTDADESKPYSVDKDTFEYMYNGSAATPEDPLAGGYVRWFRVFAITVENDGDTATGGTARDVDDGDLSSPRSDEGTDSPTQTDIDGADPKPGMTDDPRDPDDPTMIMSPPAPEDLTAEQASDTNLIEPTDRGVLLLWNEPEDPSGITGYVIQRKVGDGEFITIGAIAWVGESDFRERTSFRDSREYIEGEDLSYQVGSRGASTVEPTYTDPVMYPTTHTVHSIMLGEPTNVVAMSDAAGELTLTWEGAANAELYVLLAVDLSSVGTDTVSYQRQVITDGAARTGTVTGLTSGTRYLGIVVATRGTGADIQVEYDTATPVTEIQ